MIEPVSKPICLNVQWQKKIDPLNYNTDSSSSKQHRNVLITRSGFCFEGGAPLRESFYRYGHRAVYHVLIAYASWIRRGVQQLAEEQTYTISHNLWSSGYFHWMTEAVPRMLSLRGRASELTLLLPPFPRLREVMLATAAPIGFRSIEFFPETANVKVARLVLPSNPARKGEYDPAAIREARVLYVTAYGGGLDQPRERIYVTRHKARGRRITNESEIAEMLEAEGFRSVAFEDYSFPEQVALMSRCKILVSIHGAGLTNSMFMPAGGAVFELVRDPDTIRKAASVRRSRLANPSYVRLSSALGLKHLMQFCQPANGSDDSTLSDLIVDPHEFRTMLDKAIEVAS